MKFILVVLLVYISYTNNSFSQNNGVLSGNCDTVYLGESFLFRAIFSVNVELGAYSIDIHHNFDHHAHSTELTSCILDPKKIPVKPFLFIKTYDIPLKDRDYNVNEEINIPDDADTGDYHFIVSLTDKSGWQASRGIGFKILRSGK